MEAKRLTPQGFGELYQRVRAREGRLYPDEIAARLPAVPPRHSLAAEWHVRADSCRRLVKYLERRGTPPLVLELGCGNGWLSHQLARLAGARVWGIDLPGPELAQAGRLFGAANCRFLAADIFAAPLPAAVFTGIVLAAVVQFFPDLHALICALRPLLAAGGEIHILDSPLYPPGESAAAQQRTRAYYAALGFPEMADHYFYHPLSVLEPFSPRWLHRPTPLQRRLARWEVWPTAWGPASPFPWLVLGQAALAAGAPPGR